MKQADNFYRSKPWLGIRATVLKRDSYRCTNCGANVRGKGKARVDHIEPRKLRPDLALDERNLRTLCVPCDGARHHRDKLGKKNAGVEIGADGFPADGSWSEGG